MVELSCESPSPTGNGNGNGNTPEPLVGFYGQDLGDGSATSFDVSHNLGTSDVFTQVRNLSTGVVGSGNPTVTVVDDNNLTVSFPGVPATNEYRVMVFAVRP
jgi:hypothetical protein